MTTVSLFIRGSISSNSSAKPQSATFDLLPGINFNNMNNSPSVNLIFKIVVVVLMIDKEGFGKMGFILPGIFST